MMDTLKQAFAERFGKAPQFTAAAPGRIEFIGNHTDYNGGRVMGAALDRRMYVAVTPREDRRIRLADKFLPGILETSLEDLTPKKDKAFWSNYPLGMLVELIKAGLRAEHGFDFMVTSDVPRGAGLSSSAAFELASGYAFCGLFEFELDRAEMARAGRRAENHFVGMPCGILDQGVSAFGRKDHLVCIDCHTEEFSSVAMPAGLHFWIFNTNRKHRLVDSMYATRNKECFGAFEKLQAGSPGKEYLCAFSSAEVKASNLEGEERNRALHITSEHERVSAMQGALQAGNLDTVGELLYASHASSRDSFENSIPELDLFVELCRGNPRVIGARLTGGGFGGAVMALTHSDFSQEDADAIARDYEKQSGLKPSVFHATTGEGAGRIH